nr:hypothetical protein [Salmonella enterica subsp. enterica serovar Typhimurium]
MNALYINPVKLPPVNAGRLRERKITHSNYMVNTRGDVFATGKRQVNKKRPPCDGQRCPVRDKCIQ